MLLMLNGDRSIGFNLPILVTGIPLPFFFLSLGLITLDSSLFSRIERLYSIMSRNRSRISIRQAFCHVLVYVNLPSVQYIDWSIFFVLDGLVQVTFHSLHMPIAVCRNSWQIDMGLVISEITLFVLLLSWAGCLFSLASWWTLLFVVLGVAALVTFVFYDAKFAFPIVSHRLFFSKPTNTSSVVGFICEAILVAILYYLAWF